jgi:hypothetical protein
MAAASAIKRTGLVCPGHTRPIVDLAFASTDDGPLLLSGAKGVVSLCWCIFPTCFFAANLITPILPLLLAS